jgi:hypothetical protein
MKKIHKERKGRNEEEEGVSSYQMTLRKEKILKVERGNSSSNSVESSLWNSLWTYRKTDYLMMKYIIMHVWWP